MAHVVKKVEQAEAVSQPQYQPEERFEIFDLVDAENQNGNPVKYRQLRQVVTVSQLEEQKSNIQKQMDEVEATLQSISDLSEE
jgi:hypothetical protein